MAIIHHYTLKPNCDKWEVVKINHEGTLLSWMLDNVHEGDNFKVYEGEIAEINEISRTDRMCGASEVSVVMLPAGQVVIGVIIAVVAAAAVVLLTPKPDALANVNRQQESPNNQLSNRRNVARPNERIVDIVGQVKSIPDVMQPEYAKYDSEGIEVRTGAYCVGRKQLLIEDVRSSGTSILESGQSAGIYYPFKSPNNSTPDEQIGPVINELVVGVFESTDAVDQTILAPNEVQVDTFGTNERLFPDGTLTATIDFSKTFEVGDNAKLNQFFVFGVAIGPNPMPVIDVGDGFIQFDTTGDSSWSTLNPSGSATDTGYRPSVQKVSDTLIGPFTISSTKIDRLLFNAYAPNGLYKQNNDGKQGTDVFFTLFYQKLDDDLNPVGPETPVQGSISGNTSQTKGSTIEVNLGALTFVRWSVKRDTPKDYTFDGTVVDDLKIRSVFGLYSVDREHFGDITMIQTQRRAIEQTLLIKEPELNCIATEMVNKYESGSFSPALTPNTQGMQSLIRLALDPRVGRRTESELDLPLLESVQDEIETYFDESAAECSYSFDSTNTSAQETFYMIANAIFCTVWREGRVLKAWFEKPQSVPDMVFTHRSKRPDAETWTRELNREGKKDSIEFKYTDSELYTQETLYFPEDRSGTNPLTVEIPGIKGLEQATWRMMREYNKLIYNEITVDFTATQEGRFVKPNRLISVVKGSRVGSFDGYIKSQNGLTLELSQEVEFTQGDDHFLVLKHRDGSTESVEVVATTSPRYVTMLFAPFEPIYSENSALKTEFSFGNEAILKGQLVMPQEINPSDGQYTTIKAINYSDLYYKNDPDQPIKGGFSGGFSDGFA